MGAFLMEQEMTRFKIGQTVFIIRTGYFGTVMDTFRYQALEPSYVVQVGSIQSTYTESELTQCVAQPGIDQPAETVRDKFAMAAMGGIMANDRLAFNLIEPEMELAKLAYKVADAMLKAREVKHD